MSALDSVLVWMLSMNREYSTKVRSWSLLIFLKADNFSSRNTRQHSNSSSYAFPTKKWNMSHRIQIHSVRRLLHRRSCSSRTYSDPRFFRPVDDQPPTSAHDAASACTTIEMGWPHYTHWQTLDRTRPNGSKSNEAATCYRVPPHVQQFIMWHGCHSRNGTASH